MTLYVPAPFLVKGPNSVLIIELEGANHDCHDGYAQEQMSTEIFCRFCTLESIDYPIFDNALQTTTTFNRFRKDLHV